MGSLSEVSQDTLKTQDPLSIVTMLNRCDCDFSGYGETKAIIFAMLCLMYVKGFFEIGACWSRFGTKNST